MQMTPEPIRCWSTSLVKRTDPLGAEPVPTEECRDPDAPAAKQHLKADQRHQRAKRAAAARSSRYPRPARWIRAGEEDAARPTARKSTHRGVRRRLSAPCSILNDRADIAPSRSRARSAGYPLGRCRIRWQRRSPSADRQRPPRYRRGQRRRSCAPSLTDVSDPDRPKPVRSSDRASPADRWA